MSEFKEFERGDWVVFDTSKPYCRLLPPCLMKFIQVEDGDAVVESQGRWSLVSLAALKLASEDDIEAGHRIEDIKMEVSYGIKLNDLGVVTMGFDPGRDITHDLSDDSHIENHISPLCKSKDV